MCGITSVAFSVSGRLLFAGYDDFECKVCLFALFQSTANFAGVGCPARGQGRLPEWPRESGELPGGQ